MTHPEYPDLTVESYIYGSNRLGIQETYISDLTDMQAGDLYYRQVGFRHYELSNHLGNVINVITDKKRPVDDGTYAVDGTKTSETPDSIIDFYRPVVLAASNYYPFGMQMPGWGYNPEAYRFGFNSKEKDDEWNGSTGTIYDYGFRIYDARLAKFLSVDPLMKKYPELTPYQFASNTPIWAIDLDGLEAIHYYYAKVNDWKGYELVAKVIDDKQLKRSVMMHVQSSDDTWKTTEIEEGSYYDPIHIAKRLFRPRGIHIWGMGSLDGWTLGKKAAPEDVWGNFDYKAFMEIMSLVLTTTKSKNDWKIYTDKDAVKKRILEENRETYLNPENESKPTELKETTYETYQEEKERFVYGEGTGFDAEGSFYSKRVTTKDTYYEKTLKDGTVVKSSKEEFEEYNQ
ncbi:MAG: RHS repeat-associated core domain-containing protein [Bacteroidales bacterium]|jgi:RHS repeat-associated protein